MPWEKKSLFCISHLPLFVWEASVAISACDSTEEKIKTRGTYLLVHLPRQALLLPSAYPQIGWREKHGNHHRAHSPAPAWVLDLGLQQKGAIYGR